MAALWAAVAILWVLVIVLAVMVFALARQLGIVFERIAPMGALMTDAGPKVGDGVRRLDLTALDGDRVAIGAPSPRSRLLFFVSPTCPVCKKLLPVVKSIAGAESRSLEVILASDGEESAHRAFVAERRLEAFPYLLSADLGMTFRVSRLPYCVLLDPDGIVRAKGLVNSREQIESLLTASELGVASVQDFIGRKAMEGSHVH